MQPVIKVENLSKKYRVGKLRQQEGTLRDLLGNILRFPFKKSQPIPAAEILWALKDIDFEVHQGDTLGIIGGNGAGKSTLLKILSRIIKPTSGQVQLYGRITSLLEVGTGFHQDLTGRENIFLNGAVLGMTQRDIKQKFDEIVAFAEVERFIDTPVKFYSTGMYLRLAFAVAAHLEPDILILDEVLAVGDSAFQAKCLNKMNETVKSGRTILFVSHSSSMVEKLCRTALYLKGGRIANYGATAPVLAEYEADYGLKTADQNFSRNLSEVKDGEVKFIKWEVLNSSLNQTHSLVSGEAVEFDFQLNCRRPLVDLRFNFAVQNAEGRLLIASGGKHLSQMSIQEGVYRLRWSCRIPLTAGNYRLLVEAISVEDEELLDAWQCTPELEVSASPVDPPDGGWQGLINTQINFHLFPQSDCDPPVK